MPQSEEYTPLQNTEPEKLLVQWNQPIVKGRLSQDATLARLSLGAYAVGAILVALAVWKMEINYALLGVIIAIIPLVVRRQNKIEQSLSISLTNYRAVIGKRSYPYSELIGFWLNIDHADDGYVSATLVGKKPELIPPTFLIDTKSPEEASRLLGSLMTELEPRPQRITDRIMSYFRF